VLLWVQMGPMSDRTRVLITAGLAIALAIVSVLVMDWFELANSAAGSVAFDLRAVHICPKGSICASVSFSEFPAMTPLGFYTTLAPVVFWASLAFVAIVTYQAATKLISEHANESITRIGYGIGTIFIVCALAVGFVITPDIPQMHRTIAPVLLVLAYIAGLAALHFISREEPMATTTTTTTAPPPRAQSFPTVPIPLDAPSQAARARAGTQPTPNVARTRSRPIPLALKNKLSFSTLTAAISAGGIDAHREDGEARLVLWRDVVGAVARRLPPTAPYDGIAFVDLVSSRGSTLRILPWTRLSGDVVDGEGDARCRAFIRLVCGHCPELQLDRATQKFIDGEDPPAQLPDEATLAAHDQRLS